MEMAGRGFSGSYRFGYQGSEKDNEVSGDGNSYTTEFRQLDPRLGRWFSVDPVFQPWQSPYTSMDNNPIGLNDVTGRKAGDKGNGIDNEVKTGEGAISAYNRLSGGGKKFTKKEFAAANSDKISYNEKTGELENGGTKQKTLHPGNELSIPASPSTQKAAETLPVTFTDGRINSGADAAEAEQLNHGGDYAHGDEHPYPGTEVRILDNSTTDSKLELNMMTGLVAGAGTDVGMDLYNHFVGGGGTDLNFNNSSTLSNEIRQDQRFIDAARTFERAALSYYDGHGSLTGFDGDQALKDLNLDFSGVGTNATLATAIGGVQGLKATVTKISKDHITVEYTVFDVFGAGTADATRTLFLGLPSMWVLQHHRNEDPEDRNWYNPFVLGVTIKRSLVLVE